MVKNIMPEKTLCKEVISSIEKMRDKGLKAVIKKGRIDSDIKNGAGGIRDIEFLAQGIQLVNSASTPELICGNTLDALSLLGRHNLMPSEEVVQLQSDYEFLRRVEHCMQIFEDRQVHVLPDSEEDRKALAKRVLGFKATADEFLKEIAACRTRVRNSFKTHMTCL